MSEKRVPDLRFKGFSDDWEERKLKELFQPSKNKNNNGLYNQKDILAASLGTELIPKRTFFGLKSTKESVKNYRIVKTGDLIYTKSPIKGFPNGIIRSNKGNVGIVPPLYCVYTLQKDINSSIIQLYFEDKNRLDLYLFPLVNVGARNNVNITDLEFLEGKVTIPKSYEEQSKIVQFMEQLNTTIALHQRKLELLKRLKQGLLQQMFVRDGEKKPKLRFANFGNDWAQRKLGEMSEISRGASPRPIQESKWFDEDSEVGWLRISDVSEQNGRIYHLKQKISVLGQEKTRVLNEPHLLLSIAATVGKPVVNYVKTGVHDGFLIFYNSKFEREFMFQWLEKFRPQWQKYGQPGSQVNLNSELVKNQEVAIPSVVEQNKIGAFFICLDNTITLHQSKIEKLTALKKAYLKNLFV